MGAVHADGAAVVVSLTAEERSVLVTMAGQVGELLMPAAAEPTDPLETLVGLTGNAVETPDDPVLRRLLPDASPDAEAAAEFRRLTDHDLRRQKNEALTMLVGDLTEPGPVTLDEEHANAWLQALNDVRLTVGTRLGVSDEGDERDGLQPDDPRQAVFVAYDWLTWLQDAIVTALTDG